MSGTLSPFEISEDCRAAGMTPIRVSGGVAIRFEMRHGRSVAMDVLERDGYKVRFPRGLPHPEAIIINTGGGLVGGDCVSQSVSVGDCARAVVTTQAAERVYRALGDAETALDVRLWLGEGARLDWLPQETILFDRSRLRRSIHVDMAPSAQLLIAETFIFGRTAMGETVRTGALRDIWRIRVGGELAFAETIRLDGDMAEIMARTPIAAGSHVVATLIAIRADAEDMLAPVRAALSANTAPECETAASAWDGRLIIRALGRSSQSVRRIFECVIPVLTEAPLPRVWRT